MTMPQPGIFARGTTAHYFLEFDLRPDTATDRLIAALRRLWAPVASGNINLVGAFGVELWQRLSPDLSPLAGQPSAGVDDPKRASAPRTEHDIWLWLNSSDSNVLFEHAREAALALREVAVLAAEPKCFKQHDGHDLADLLDGIGGTSLLEAPAAALVPTGAPGEGGSYVLAMRWVQNIKASRSSVAEASARGSQEVAGGGLPVYHRAIPYRTHGAPTYNVFAERGLYFIAFGADPARLDLLLARISGGSDDSPSHRLTDFARSVSEGRYFAPSLTSLAKLIG